MFLVASCKGESDSNALSAKDIINKSIEISGGKNYRNSIIRFDFRDKAYVANREKREFSFLRLFKQNSDSIIDILDNSGFKRMVDKEFIMVEDSMAVKYTASVNSVHYFSVLPYGLNDKAVIKELLGEELIKGEAYYKIKVTFNEQGGGEDFEDVFVYWVNKQMLKTDYIAYSYNEDDGVGMRFREAYNERYINKLRFVDYNNYKSENTSIALFDLGKAFNENQLKLLSKIELKNVKVDLLYD